MMQFLQIIQENQFLVAILGSGIVAGLLGLLYKAFNLLKQFLHYTYIYSLIVNSTNDYSFFQMLDKWIYRQKKVISTSFNLGSYNDYGQRQLVIGNGTHIIKYKKKYLLINRYVDNNSHANEKQEYIIIKMFKKNINIFNEIINEINKEMYIKPDGVYCNVEKYWDRVSVKQQRSLNSIILNNGLKESLINKIQFFLDNKEYYAKRQILYKIGFLFYSDAGAGKSSCVIALSNYFNLPIYYLDLSTVLNNNQLLLLMSCLPKHYPFILLIEDIDTLKMTHDREQIIIDQNPHSSLLGSLTLSSLLNVLDGILSPENMITIMTTNYIEKLDKALIRKGRIDHSIEFTHLTKKSIVQYLQDIVQYDLSQENINSIPDDIHVKGCDIHTLSIDILMNKNLYSFDQLLPNLIALKQ
jgi:chaperone BCS1